MWVFSLEWMVFLYECRLLDTSQQQAEHAFARSSQRLSIPLFDTIDQALCLGAKHLSVLRISDLVAAPPR